MILDHVNCPMMLRSVSNIPLRSVFLSINSKRSNAYIAHWREKSMRNTLSITSSLLSFFCEFRRTRRRHVLPSRWLSCTIRAVNTQPLPAHGLLLKLESLDYSSRLVQVLSEHATTMRKRERSYWQARYSRMLTPCTTPHIRPGLAKAPRRR